MPTLEEQRSEYEKYINNHQANVWKVWFDNMDKFAAYFLLDLATIRSIQKDIACHDESKFSEEEFEPYRKQFFPLDNAEKESNKESFEMAIKHHFEKNPHHWNYWVDEDGHTDEMDDANIIHMICDWMAMGIQFGNTAAEYYDKNRDKIKLAPNTRIKVESYLAKIEGGKV